MTTQFTRQAIAVQPMEPATAAGRGRLGAAFHRIRRAVAEMNYASRRFVELQAPWTVDSQWDRR